MNNKINLFNKLLILLSVLVILTSCDRKEDKVIATVNGEKIYLKDFKNRYEDFLLSSGISDTYPNRQNILNSMVTEVLMQKFDNNDSVYANKEYQREKKWVDEEALLGFVMDRDVFAKISASDKEIRTAFKRANVKVAARHLYAKTLDEANELYSLLETGVSFDLLAKQVFTDSTLRNNGGYLGFFSWGDMDPAFEEAAYTLPIGKISKPIKTEEGYSIIKVEKRVANPLLTEDEYMRKKKQIERLVKINKKKPAEHKFINGLIDLDKININEKALNDVYKKYLLILNEKLEVKSVNNGGEVVSDYKGKKFTVAQIINRLEELPYYHREKIKTIDNLKTAVKGFYLKDILLNYAKEKGYDKNPYVLKKERQLETNLFMRYKMINITKNAEVSDSAAYDFYKENKKYFTTDTKYHVKEIIVKRKSLADSLIKVLRKNRRRFSSLAKKYSLRKFSAVNGGDLGWAPIEKFGLLRKKIFHAKLNELLGPLKIKGYYGIFIVAGKKKGKVTPFNQIKDKVKAAAKFYYRNDIFKKYTQNLFEKNKIDINFNLLKNTPMLNYH